MQCTRRQTTQDGHTVANTLAIARYAAAARISIETCLIMYAQHIYKFEPVYQAGSSAMAGTQSAAAPKLSTRSFQANAPLHTCWGAALLQALLQDTAVIMHQHPARMVIRPCSLLRLSAAGRRVPGYSIDHDTNDTSYL